jgi:DNA-binding transcriptional ArsR family regulator
MSRTKLRRFFRHGLLPQLFAFDAVARLGSVTRAAEELYLAQPTVSLQLKKLSESLGLPLIELRGRRMRLTAAGRILQDLCAELDRAFCRADEHLAELDALFPPANNGAGKEEGNGYPAGLQRGGRPDRP